jgi:hypothetical protein
MNRNAWYVVMALAWTAVCAGVFFFALLAR